MQMVLFVIAQVVVMYAIGSANRDVFISIADPAPVPFLLMIAIGFVMGLLSGSIIRHSTNRVLWVTLHTASTVVPLSIGMQTVSPFLLPFGAGAVFLIGCLLTLLLSEKVQEEEVGLETF